jgi:Peroxidase
MCKLLFCASRDPLLLIIQHGNLHGIMFAQVDLTNGRNNGLEEPINALAPIVKKYKASLSRADIWALAAMVASQVSQPDDAAFKVNFDLTEYGRINCEKQQSICLDLAGISHGCSATRGPHREMPGSKFNTHEVFDFFKTNYDFSVRESVAIMGGHTIGELSSIDSGIDGPNGFVTENRILNNEYYAELVGDMGNLVQGAPVWTQHFEDNSNLNNSKIDDVYVWRRNPPALKGDFIVMTDADISIVRDLSGKNLNPQTGEVNCQFVDNAGNKPSCPKLKGALDEAARYKFSNRAWLTDFEAALRKMLNAGYTITSDCLGDLCKLAKHEMHGK